MKTKQKAHLAPYQKPTFSGRVFDVINIVFMLVFAFCMLYPFWNQLVISLNEGTDTNYGGLYFWPRQWTLANYAYIFEKGNLGKGALISVLRVVVGTSTTLFCSGLLAYVTTVRGFSGRRFMRIVYLITMYFGGGMIPTYLLMVNLGLLNTFTVYWLPGLFSAYYMMLIASYIYGLPESLMESARIDGAGEMRIYFQIILPLCVPVLAAIGIMAAVGHWNSWFDVMVYNPKGEWDTLQAYLRRILTEATMASQLLNDQQQQEAMRKLTTSSIRAATTMVVTIPIVCVYPFFQRYFISGMTIGAVKG